jgi:hypothetical protein
MSVEYSAKIVVGLPVEEMKDLRNEEGCWDEDGVLEFVPDSYDSPSGIVGLVVNDSGCYAYTELSVSNLYEGIEAALNKFFETTKREGKVFLSTCGY